MACFRRKMRSRNAVGGNRNNREVRKSLCVTCTVHEVRSSSQLESPRTLTFAPILANSISSLCEPKKELVRKSLLSHDTIELQSDDDNLEGVAERDVSLH